MTFYRTERIHTELKPYIQTIFIVHKLLNIYKQLKELNMHIQVTHNKDNKYCSSCKIYTNELYTNKVYKHIQVTHCFFLQFKEEQEDLFPLTILTSNYFISFSVSVFINCIVNYLLIPSGKSLINKQTNKHICAGYKL